MVIIGERIKDLRKKSKLTQTELANMLGVTKSTVAAYENNTRLPSYDVLLKMARIFKVSTDYLLTGRRNDQLEIEGLKKDQVEAVDSLIASFKKSNLLEEALIEESSKNEKLLERLNAYKNIITKSNEE